MLPKAPVPLGSRSEREREIVSSERAAGAFLVDGEGEGLTDASGVESEGLDWGDEVGGIDGRVQNEAGLAVEVAGEKPGLRSRSRGEGGRFLRWRSLNEREEEEIASVDSLGDLGEGGARDSPVDPVDRATAAGLCARALCLRARRGGAPTATRTILWRSSWRASDLTGRLVGRRLDWPFCFPCDSSPSRGPSPSHRLAAKPVTAGMSENISHGCERRVKW